MKQDRQCMCNVSIIAHLHNYCCRGKATVPFLCIADAHASLSTM